MYIVTSYTLTGFSTCLPFLAMSQTCPKSSWSAHSMLELLAGKLVLLESGSLGISFRGNRIAPDILVAHVFVNKYT